MDLMWARGRKEDPKNMPCGVGATVHDGKGVIVSPNPRSMHNHHNPDEWVGSWYVIFVQDGGQIDMRRASVDRDGNANSVVFWPGAFGRNDYRR